MISYVYECCNFAILVDLLFFFELWFGDDCESWFGFVYVDFVCELIFVKWCVSYYWLEGIDIDLEDSSDSRF